MSVIKPKFWQKKKKETPKPIMVSKRKLVIGCLVWLALLNLAVFFVWLSLQ